MVHNVFSVVAPVAPDRVDSLRRRLEVCPLMDRKVRHHYPGGNPLPIVLTPANLPTLHFASLVVFDSQELPKSSHIPKQPPTDARGTEPTPDASRSMGYLVLECCIDGPEDAFLDALVALDEKQGGPLQKAFEYCDDFEHTTLRQYLGVNKCHPQLLHIGIPGMRRTHVEWGRKLRSRVDRHLDRLVEKGRSGDDPVQIIEELRTELHVPASSDEHLHYTPAGWIADPSNPWPSRIRNWSKAAGALALSALALLGVLAIAWSLFGVAGAVAVVFLFALSGWAVWSWLHGHNRASVRVDTANLAALKEREDHEVQNHMCTLTPIQNSPFRRAAVRIVLRLFNLAYRTVYTDVTPGRLSGLPTIHFAHWSIVPLADANTKKPSGHEALMFLSNYDGSWDAYLDDFFTLLFPGIVAIWSCCVGFRWPLNAPTFKAYARSGMTPWQGWYVAVPQLTVRNIHNHDQIRRGLLQPSRTRDQARLWLARLGAVKEDHESIPEYPAVVQSSDVQGIVLAGYRHLACSSFIPLRITDPARARKWLNSLLPQVTSAQPLPEDWRRAEYAVNIAFTWRGLAALGLPKATCDAFPLAFQEGMASARNPHRSRALGDVGPSAPERWQWGGCEEKRQADILLMLYATSSDGLEALKRRHVVPFTHACGDRVRAPIQGTFIPSNGKGPLSKFPTEHFGFLDGISQPEIEGTWRSDRPHSRDIVKPGEFLLGYQAEDGTISAGVPVAARHDPQGFLPFASNGRFRDFGRNGSYLVVRQLRQHVAEFREFVSATARVSGGPHAWETVASRLVGRASNGMPLAVDASPDAPNQFTFADDPHGFRCPIGAHMRRANPRDSLGDDPAAALMATRRRRLLRRGRTYGRPLPYGAPDDGVERGLLFICLNSDIERQFEFVQQNWINGPAFGGLYAERDPVIGEHRDDEGLLTIQADGVRERLTGIERFVTVAGGDYFFLPGLSALRYLASAGASEPVAPYPGPATAPARELTVPAAPHTPLVTTVLRGVERALPVLSLLWAVRFPILTAAALVFAPLAAAGSRASIGVSFFLTDWLGLVIVAMLASLAASVVMITSRLVLLYGERVGLSRSRWCRPPGWIHVLAFQALALPVTVACMHWTAIDSAWTPDQISNPVGYSLAMLRLVPAAFLGIGIGLVLLDLATWIQGLRPGARPDLMFPANPLTGALGARRHRMGHGLLSRLLSRMARALIDQIPPALGTGYIDYRERRLLPGHAFAAALAAVVFAVYAAGYVALSPQWSWSPAGRIPSIAYVLLLLMAAAWITSAMAFFLDRYRLSTVVMLVAWLAVTASVAHTDHYFPVGARLTDTPTPEAALAAAQAFNPAYSKRIVVVMSEGQGLISSAWTAHVLGGLAAHPNGGAAFTGSLRLLSASSGASLGTTHFVNAYSRNGFRFETLDAVRENAARPSSGEVGWGFAYPDLLRTFAPLLVPQFVDRGWAMEQAWRRSFSGSEPMLSAWQRQVAEGWRPATAFGVTATETGEHAVIATYKTDTPAIPGGRDLSMITAARLSATFPFISPPTRAAITDDNEQPPAYHLIDSGMTDNSGWTAVRDWLQAVQSDLKDRDVMLVDIRSLPSRQRNPAADEDAWTLELIAPLRALLEARTARHTRVADEIADFGRWWQTSHRPIQHVTFALDDSTVPLSWNLGRADGERLRRAWERNRRQAAQVCAFVTGAASCTE